MRAAAEREWCQRTGYVWVNGRAEATGLPHASVDLVPAAQAFHRFDQPAARTEFRRILTPPGWVSLIWNHRLTSGAPFLDGYERVLRELGTDYAAVNHRNLTTDRNAVIAWFGGDPTAVRLMEFECEQVFDEAGLLGRAFSSSHTPRPGDPRRKAMAEARRDLFRRTHEGGFERMKYVTLAVVGRPTRGEG